MRRCTAFATALALTAGLSLPVHAEPGEALDRLLEGGAMESLVLRELRAELARELATAGRD